MKKRRMNQYAFLRRIDDDDEEEEEEEEACTRKSSRVERQGCRGNVTGAGYLFLFPSHASCPHVPARSR